MMRSKWYHYRLLQCAILVGVLLCTLLFCSACHDRFANETQFTGGIPVGMGELESIRLTFTETEQETPGELVYWVEGGSGATYHTHMDCTYLSGKQIASGKRFDAYCANKMELCSRCAKRDGVEPGVQP